MSSLIERTLLRPARPEDLAQAQEIAVQAWEVIYRSFRRLVGEEIWAIAWPDAAAMKRQEIKGHFDRYPQWVLVTELDGKVVGFITYLLEPSRKLGIIGNNGVHPDYQGQGIGTRQQREVLDIFRREGMLVANVFTGLDEGHTKARAAYAKVGFKLGIPMINYYLKL